MANPPMTDNDIAAVVSAAVQGERERCARIAETEEGVDGEPDAATLDAMIAAGPIVNARAAAIRATKKSIAQRIRAYR